MEPPKNQNPSSPGFVYEREDGWWVRVLESNMEANNNFTQNDKVNGGCPVNTKME